jgi:hypothetical protein
LQFFCHVETILGTGRFSDHDRRAPSLEGPQHDDKDDADLNGTPENPQRQTPARGNAPRLARVLSQFDGGEGGRENGNELGGSQTLVRRAQEGAAAQSHHRQTSRPTKGVFRINRWIA